MRHHREVLVEAMAEPHNVSRIRKKPGWPPLIVQRGDPAANEVRPDHLKGELSPGQPKNPGGGDSKPPVSGVDITPIAAADRRHSADLAKFQRVFVLNPAPPVTPFIPPLLHGTIRVRPLGSWDPGDATKNGTSRLDSRIEIMAEERRVGLHPGKALAEMRKERHARHRIRSKIQEAKTEGVHNVAEEIG